MQCVCVGKGVVVGGASPLLHCIAWLVCLALCGHAQDMIVNFFLGFFSSEGQWVFENGPIACHYLKYVFVCVCVCACMCVFVMTSTPHTFLA